MTTSSPPPLPVPVLLDLLLGEAARDLVDAVVDARDVGRLGALRPVSVSVRPAGGVLVRYSADVERPHGGRVREHLVAATGEFVPAGAAMLSGEVDGHTVGVGLWRWPHDPALPALAHLHDRERLRQLLRRAGMDPDVGIRTRLRTYRPGQRAVWAVTAGPRTCYVKVVRPRRIAALRRRHELLADALPVPPPLTTTDDGLLVMAAFHGEAARAVLRGSGPVPDPVALETLLDHFPDALTTFPASSGNTTRARHYADVLALTALPGEADRRSLDDVVDAIAAADTHDQPVVPVHGDFHDQQLLVRGGTVTGLLDVDTAGPGHRVDDWATLVAHLVVQDTTATRRWAREVTEHAERRFTPGQFGGRVATAVLGLATGPFRTRQPNWAARTRARTALAREWLDRR